MSYKSSSSSPSLLRITIGSLGLKATWSGTAFYTALLSMRRWTLFPMLNSCFHIYFFQQSVITAREAGEVLSHSWNNPLLQQPWGREVWSLFCLCKFTYKRYKEKMNGFARHKYQFSNWNIWDLSDVLSHHNRAGLRQIKCPCESCKMPLYYDAPSKQIQCSGPSDVTRLLMLMQVLNSSFKMYVYTCCTNWKQLIYYP